jgi:hypothetical protein
MQPFYDEMCLNRQKPKKPGTVRQNVKTYPKVFVEMFVEKGSRVRVFCLTPFRLLSTSHLLLFFSSQLLSFSFFLTVPIFYFTH